MKVKHKVGNTVYSLMTDKDDGTVYIVQKIYGHVAKWRFLGYTRYKRIIESIDYIPVNVSTLAIMFNILRLSPITDDELDIGEYTKYELITPEMNKDFIDELNVELENLDEDIHSIKVGDVPDNGVVKGFIEDGWHYFSTESHNSMRRGHYVYRSGLYEGYLHLFLIEEIGFRDKDAIVSHVGSVLLPREFIIGVLDAFGYFNLDEGDVK